MDSFASLCSDPLLPSEPPVTDGGRDVAEEEWLDGLRHLTGQQKSDVHFGLQEQIKKHYKLCGDPNHLSKAIGLCKQQIAFASLALTALKAAHDQSMAGYHEHHEHIESPSLLSMKTWISQVRSLFVKAGKVCLI